MKGIRINVAVLVCVISFIVYIAGRLLLLQTTTLKDLIEDSYLTTVNMLYFAACSFQIYFIFNIFDFIFHKVLI